MSTDEEIKKDVTDQMYWDSRVDASNIKVKVEQGNVILEGDVPSFHTKESAFNDAYAITGVLFVENNLEISYEVDVPADEEIAADVRSSLLWNPNLDTTKIEVTVDSGVVTLRGSVEKYWKKYKVEWDVSNINGVISVINELSIVGIENNSDEHIADAINKAFERNMYIDNESIDIEVKNGVVTLTGRVSSWFVRTEVVDTVSYTYGVKEINEQIAIE